MEEDEDDHDPWTPGVLSENLRRPSSPRTQSSRSNRVVWTAVGLSLLGFVPLFGAYFGLAGCAFAVAVLFGRAFSARQRGTAAVAFALGAALTVFWIWFSTLTFI